MDRFKDKLDTQRGLTFTACPFTCHSELLLSLSAF